MEVITNLAGHKTTEQLYAGSRTLVYRGVRESDRTPVVIKLLRNSFPSFNELLQFRNQYIITNNLDIPSIVKPLALEPYENSYALIMEDFGGISLKELLKQNGNLGKTSQSLILFLQIAIQVAEALDGLYRNRVIHKDIKPANILIHPHSKIVKLIDFSIASVLPRETQEIQNVNSLEGTLAYLSPEQTGRMNRGVDYRSDFYALGVTFYELLTGQLPFICADPMDLVHCHLAKLPTPLHQINANIPVVISEMVDKLMAKNAEDRYQNALGLKYDLEICLHQLQENNKIEKFDLGTRDLYDRFLIPEKLYGRQVEVDALLNAFERISTGTAELMLVAGFSGIGKTAVVNEVHKPIVRQRGYFIKGKYDQFQRNIPFSAFVQAFRNLMTQLLTESDTQLQTWKNKILEAVGASGQVLIEVIPELEGIISSQPQASELSGNASENRFNLLMQKFVRVFTDSEHPLVLFLDDLQWADSASLKLLQLLMLDTGYLLILGAYRDNEVSPAHPFMLTVDAIQRSGATVNSITLQPLSLEDINHLVADTLNCDRNLAQPLTELVDRKTGGNPFFATQFLKSLYEDGQIVFNWVERYWQCDIVQVGALSLTDNVVEFMGLQLQKLPITTQNTLKLAACIGAQFSLQTLSIVSEQSLENTASSLWSALQEGLVVPLNDIYKFFTQIEHLSANFSEEVKSIPNPTYKFLHDRVQQASYQLIPEYQKQITHLNIGKLLLQQIPLERQESHIFEIVNQLNLGSAYIEEAAELKELANLNLKAGCKARLSTAYGSAAEYLQAGLDALGEQRWETDYSLSLGLYEELAEVEYLRANFDLALELVGVIIDRTETLLDRIRAYELTVQIYISQDKQVEAIETGLQTLKHLGVSLVPETADHQPYLERLPTIETLDRFPTMSDPGLLAAMRILMAITPPTHHVKPHLFPSVALTLIELCLENGNSPLAAYAYGIYGLFLTAVANDIESAYRAGKLSLKLIEQYHAKDLKTKVEMLFGVFVCAGKEPGRATIALLQESIRNGLEVGDIEYTSYCIMADCAHEVLVGEFLDTTNVQQEIYTNLLIQFQQKHCLDYTRIWRQLIQNLQGLAETPSVLTGDDFNEALMLQHFHDTHNHQSLFAVYLVKTLLDYTLENYNEAWFYANEAEKYADGAFGILLVSAHNFYQSLAAIVQVKNSVGNRTELLQKVKTNQSLMQSWADHAPMNYLHKYHLVEAEYSWVIGNKAEAIEHYDRAIALAQEFQFQNDEALANELAAKFYLGWGKEKIAQSYLTDAYYAYSRWGAKAKVDDLEERYPQLLAPILQNRLPSFSTNETIFAISSSTPTKSSTSSTGISEVLDIAAIIKASQSLSSEIELEKLLSILLQIVSKNAGADKCVLIMPKDNDWVIEALSQIGEPEQILQSIPTNGSQVVPTSLINTVARTLKPSIIWDATLHPILENDSYILSQQPKSILCNPILNQGQLIGILYLENNLTVGAFTNDRIEVLNLICSQAAISLQNARLYANEQERARFLELAKQDLEIFQTKLTFLIESTPLAVIEWNHSFEVIGWNPAAEKIFGYSADEMLNKHALQIVPKNYRDYVVEVMRDLTNQKGGTYSINENITKDGRAIICEWINTPLVDDNGNSMGIYSMIQDITDRKLIEAERLQKSLELEKALQNLQETQLQMIQSEKMSALGNLVAGVAHEINNPIGFISGNLHEAKQTVLDLVEHLNLYRDRAPEAEIANHAEDIDVDYLIEDLPKMIDSMKLGCDRIRNISTSLRTFSRADQNYAVSVDIHDGIDSTLMILKHRLKANESRPEIQVIKEYSGLPKVECYAGQLNQVFMNILANAIDALEESDQGLTYEEIEASPNQITIKTELATEQQIRIRIRDNGEGMTEDVKLKIFEHLFTTKGVGKGTGLGLAIAKQIVVEKHGGAIEVNSTLGQGTEFLILLPINGQSQIETNGF